MRETPSITRESFEEAHRILECTHTHPPVNQHQKGHNLLVGCQGSEIVGESLASGLFPSLTPPPQTAPQGRKEGTPCLALPFIM